MGTSKISIERIEKRFKNNIVLKDVSLECEKGHIYGIVGRNGSGKTVLFKCLCGFLRINSGNISVDGISIREKPEYTKNFGIIIEEPAFLSNYSGIKNLEFLYTINHKKDKLHLKEIMLQVGLEPACKKHVGKYSMGMRQRLAIGQAIMEEQKILILDEPMNGLDKTGVEEMRQLFLKLRKEGRTILLASHNKEDIDVLCDEVYEIDSGILSRIR